MMRRSLFAFSFFLSLTLLAGCALDVNNPNAATEDDATSTAEGIRTLTVGLQEVYATELVQQKILTTGVTAREVAIFTTFQNLIDLEDGGEDLPNTNANVGALWGDAYRVVGTADRILQNAPSVNLAPGTESGVLATAELFKALALGTVAQAFEQGPVSTSRSENAPFVERQALLAEALALLQSATDRLAATPPSDDFLNDVLASGIDLSNTIAALQARYHLLAGNNDAAIGAANRVDPSIASRIGYDDLSQNPVWNQVRVAESYAPRDGFGFEGTDSNDERLDFYLTPADTTSTNGYPIDEIDGFFRNADSGIPLYLPGEMSLIRAEAKLRRGDAPGEVIAEINAVRTKTAAEDPYGLGAGLPPYTGPTDAAALEAEILAQRRAELFLQGQALGDLRRLGPTAPDPADPFSRSRNFYPYPQQERINNPNTPADPEI